MDREKSLKLIKKENLFWTVWRKGLLLKGSYILSALFVAFSFILSLFIPKGSFVITGHVIGSGIDLISLVIASGAAVLIGFGISMVSLERDRVVAYVMGFVSVAVSALILIKVASVLYFW